MKELFVLSAFFTMSAACALGGESASVAPRTEVVFEHPEKFTDIRDMDPSTDQGREAILGEIRDFLVRRTSSIIPNGYKLLITFTDIRLAGDFELWHGPMADNTRIVRDIYPPAFKFTYSVSDRSGKVVRRGAEDIVDLDFQTRLEKTNITDHLHYEKDILGGWARSALRGLK